jgi:anti-sigma B factor antagonist
MSAGGGRVMITQDRIDENTVAICPGQTLDNSNAHEMTEILNTAQTDGYKYLILDMNGLEFLSSAGVGSILGSLGKTRDSGGDIILCNVPEKILHVLKILDLCDYLTIRQSREEARDLCAVKG